MLCVLLVKKSLIQGSHCCDCKDFLGTAVFYIIIMCLCERLITSQKVAAIMEEKERYTLFYGIQSPFSQFHPSKFTIGGVMYRCAEQYMMYCKAITFKDYITAKNLWR